MNLIRISHLSRGTPPSLLEPNPPCSLKGLAALRASRMRASPRRSARAELGGWRHTLHPGHAVVDGLDLYNEGKSQGSSRGEIVTQIASVQHHDDGLVFSGSGFLALCSRVECFWLGTCEMRAPSWDMSSFCCRAICA